MSYDGALTPGRVTKAHFDITEQVGIAEPFGFVRRGVEIAKLAALGKADASISPGLKFWPGRGCWTLAPVQESISAISEYIDLLNLTIPLSAGTVATSAGLAAVEVAQMWRQQTELPGMAYSAMIASTSDQFHIKAIPAGQTWQTFHPSTYGQVPGVGIDVPLDRLFETSVVYPTDQAFFIRWSVPGIGRTAHRELISFYFGQYCVCFLGNGIVDLYENCLDSTNAPVWRKRDSWRYSRINDVSGQEHVMAIWPHLDDYGNKSIVFSNSADEAAGFVSGAVTADANQIAPGEHVYLRNPLIVGSDQDLADSFSVTTSDKMRYDVRRDLRPHVQISKLGWSTSGYLLDLPALLRHPYNIAPTVRLDTVTPGTTSITPTVNDQNTLAAFNPATDIKPFVRFDFSGDGYTTPILWGYTFLIPPIVETIAPGEFVAAGDDYASQLNEVQITSAETDPSHAGGRLVVSDLAYLMPRLHVRGEFSVKVTNTYTPTDTSGDPQQTVTLFRGYAKRPHSTQIGKPGASYPHPKARKFEMPLFGMWLRLYERVADQYLRTYANDEIAGTDANGRPQPWKATDAIRDLLYGAGFTNNEVNIPDLPFRLWQGQIGKNDDLTVSATSHYADVAVRFAKDYLGAILWWENNAGANGQWMLLFPPADTDPVLWNFVTASSATNPFVPPHITESYPAKTSPVFGEGGRTIVPPDNNVIEVVAPTAFIGSKDKAQVTNHLYNPYGYNFPGCQITADPNDADYIGRLRGLKFADLGCVQPTFEETQAAVNFKLARLGDFLTHAQQIEHFQAALVFIKDTTTMKYRMLRYFDRVNFNGVPYYLRCCNPDYSSGRMQMATYEVVKTNRVL